VNPSASEKSFVFNVQQAPIAATSVVASMHAGFSAALSQGACSMATLAPTALRSVYITGLRNAHALENQALGMIDRQLDRLENFPEVADRLRLHRRETEQQIVRLDDIMSEFDTSASGSEGRRAQLHGQYGRDRPRHGGRRDIEECLRQLRAREL
jgi:hypothetical protein